MLGAFLLAAAAASGHINPAQSIESAYSAKAEMRFHTLNYSAMVCTDPQYAVRANLISSGMGATTDPQYDAQWLETQKANKNCFQLAPTFGFKTTNAFAVFAGVNRKSVGRFETKSRRELEAILVCLLRFQPLRIVLRIGRCTHSAADQIRAHGILRIRAYHRRVVQRVETHLGFRAVRTFDGLRRIDMAARSGRGQEKSAKHRISPKCRTISR